MNPTTCPTGYVGSPNIPLVGCVDFKNPLEIAIFGGIVVALFMAKGSWKVIVPVGLLVLRNQLGKMSL